MTGYQSKRAAAQDKLDDDDAQVYIAEYEAALQKEYQRGYSDGTAQRTWVGLTPDELNAIFDGMKTWSSFQITDVYFAIESKLKERNA